MINKFIIQTLIVLLLSACASSGDRDSGGVDLGDDLEFTGNDCILIRTIRDYTPLDRQHLLIHGPGRRSYFVTLFHQAFDMRGSIGFQVQSRDEQLCPFGGDRIVFGAFGGESVGVQAISRLTDEQKEFLLIRYGKQEPDGSETPAEAPEVKGAEVEELG